MPWYTCRWLEDNLVGLLELLFYSCEPPCDYWEVNPGVLEEQQPVLSTSGPSHQSLYYLFLRLGLTV